MTTRPTNSNFSKGIVDAGTVLSTTIEGFQKLRRQILSKNSRFNLGEGWFFLISGTGVSDPCQKLKKRKRGRTPPLIVYFLAFFLFSTSYEFKSGRAPLIG